MKLDDSLFVHQTIPYGHIYNLIFPYYLQSYNFIYTSLTLVKCLFPQLSIKYLYISTKKLYIELLTSFKQNYWRCSFWNETNFSFYIFKGHFSRKASISKYDTFKVGHSYQYLLYYITCNLLQSSLSFWKAL